MRLLSAHAAQALHNARRYRELEDRLAGQIAPAEGLEPELAGGFAHEMRNALAGCRVVLDRAREVLARERRPEESERHRETLLGNAVEILHKAVLRGLSIASDTLEYARLGRVRPGGPATPLAEILQLVREESRQDPETAHIRIDLRTDETMTINAPEDHLYSIFKNLALNAVDALQGAPEPLIEIHAERQGDYGVISMEDNGAGIAPEHIPYIFDPFYTTKPEGGTGLGLGVVRKIVTMYLGEIEVSSKARSYTRFTVRLPAGNVT